MERRTFRHPVFYYLVPAVLVLVACLQLWRAHTQHLTPWKGGGFGMFSTVDAPGQRILRTYLLTPEGEALALFGTLSVQTLRVTSMPDAETLEQVARDAAGSHWRIYPFEEVLDEIASLPEDLRKYLARTPAMARRRAARRQTADSLSAPVALPDTSAADYPARIAFAQSQPPPPGTEQPEILGVRVEVWALRFDQQTDRAAPELLESITLNLD